MIDGVHLLALLAKILAGASVVVVASIAAEKAGPLLGGLIATFPVSAGPAYIVIAAQSDSAFVAASAQSSLATNASTGLFVAVYVFLAQRCGLALSLGAATASWLGAAMAIRAIPWTTPTAALLNVVVYGLGIFALRRVALDRPVPRLPRRWFDLPARAALVGCLIAFVTTFSHAIGPKATGIAAAYPVMFSSLIVILHLRLGGPIAAAAMASAMRGMPGMAVAFLIVAVAAQPLGSAVALTLALTACLVWSGGLMALKTRSRRA